MSSKTKLNTGVLTAEEKVYIVENFTKVTIEELASKLKRTVATVSKYLEKIKVIDAVDKVKKKVKKDNFITEKTDISKHVTTVGVATVMDGAENLPFHTSPPPNPFKYE